VNQVDRHVLPNPRGGATSESGTDLRHKAAWCVNLGIALITLGILATCVIGLSGVNVVVLIGWLMVVSGLAEAIHAFHLRKSSAFLFHIVPAIAGLPVGLLVVTHPSAGGVAWMLVFASSFTVIGLFRAISAFRLKFPNWTWAAVDGAVTLLLATMFWTTWAWLVPWFFPLAVGVSLILRGWASIMLGLGMHSSNREHLDAYRDEQPFLNRFLQSRSYWS
jgi:uncharacterized membrane protein HdeD (DUF308 family)